MRSIKQILCLMTMCLPVMFITSCSDDDEEDYGTSTTQGQQGGESEPTDIPDVPSNQIWYDAWGKLTEIIDKYGDGLHTDAFNATIISHTFSDGKGIITFDAAVTEIKRSAFYRCSNLKSISIPGSVTSIGEYAFCSCEGLTSIDIPNSVSSIERSTFEGCSGLTSVTIGNSVNSIGGYAFDHCSSLTSINIPNSVIKIGEDAFQSCSSLTSINIPNSVTEIDGDCFNGCNGLTRITVADGNKVYDSRDNCNAIIETASNTLIRACENTVIPNSVTAIGGAAFNGCSGLTSIGISSSVTEIGNRAFQYCSNLTSINIPNSVTGIGYGAFIGCSSLTSVYVNWDKPLSISSYTFYDGVNLSGCTLYVPKGTKSLYASAEVWKDFGNIVEQP